ncbi:MAG TPA: 3-hydroxyacyl-CoA dehydrogenase family protein [Candidatus Binatia bacterium]|nr:3-hydroxyacyl-CoA dehydrogenase family protein [Candidatus Binatia bacterium]
MTVDEIRHIAVVGAGLMGHGIAQEFALAGYEVHLHSRREESLQTALNNIQANLERLIGMGVVTRVQAEAVPARLHPTPVLAQAVAGADVVIESIYEDATLKHQLFQALDTLCPAHTILASNTSTLPLSRFASGLRRSDKVLVAHYANPPYLIPLVELVRGPQTADDTVTTTAALLTRIGKRPIVVRQEVPGFILNRLQGALLREALWLVQNGVASPQDIDTALKNSIGRRWAVAGVFEIFELAGWDLLNAIAAGLFPHLASSPEVPQVLEEKVAHGELGVKTGKGFYEWTPESAEALRQRIARALVAIERWS